MLEEDKIYVSSPGGVWPLLVRCEMLHRIISRRIAVPRHLAERSMLDGYNKQSMAEGIANSSYSPIAPQLSLSSYLRGPASTHMPTCRNLL
jgi:hypothetical protein